MCTNILHSILGIIDRTNVPGIEVRKWKEIMLLTLLNFLR